MSWEITISMRQDRSNREEAGSPSTGRLTRSCLKHGFCCTCLLHDDLKQRSRTSSTTLTSWTMETWRKIQTTDAAHVARDNGSAITHQPETAQSLWTHWSRSTKDCPSPCVGLTATMARNSSILISWSIVAAMISVLPVHAPITLITGVMLNKRTGPS